MTKHRRFALQMLILSLAVTNPVMAFDGNRKGFCLGLGAGLGTGTIVNDGRPNYQTPIGLQMSQTIGWGLSDQIVIVLSGHMAIYNEQDSNGIWVMPGVFFRYYFKPSAPSFYISGGPALVVLASEGVDSFLGIDGGAGATLGGGYHLSRYFQLQLEAALASGSIASFRTIHATANLALY